MALTDATGIQTFFPQKHFGILLTMKRKKCLHDPLYE